MSAHNDSQISFVFYTLARMWPARIDDTTHMGLAIVAQLSYKQTEHMTARYIGRKEQERQKLKRVAMNYHHENDEARFSYMYDTHQL